MLYIIIRRIWVVVLLTLRGCLVQRWLKLHGERGLVCNSAVVQEAWSVGVLCAVVRLVRRTR